MSAHTDVDAFAQVSHAMCEYAATIAINNRIIIIIIDEFDAVGAAIHCPTIGRVH